MDNVPFAEGRGGVRLALGLGVDGVAVVAPMIINSEML